jgi:hypothetical protein
VAASSQKAAIAQVLLEGIPLPVRKEKVLEYAERQGAEPEILTLLRTLPNEQFRNLDEIGEALVPVQPAFAPPDPQLPREESDAVPGGEGYLDASHEPGWIREQPQELDYEKQLVVEAQPGDDE